MRVIASAATRGGPSSRSLAAMCSAGWRARRPVTRRICSRQEVPAATPRRRRARPARAGPRRSARQVGVDVAEGARHAAAAGPGGARGHPGLGARAATPSRRRPGRGRGSGRGPRRRGRRRQRRRGRRRATARSKPTAASATHRARGSPGSSARDVVRPASTSTRAPAPRSAGPASAWGASRPSAAGPAAAPRHEPLRQQRAAAAARVHDASRAAPRGPQHAQGGVPDAGLDVAGEGVGHHDHRRHRPMPSLGRQGRTAKAGAAA